MAVNTVKFGPTVLMDITDTTATATSVESGKAFYLANGTKVNGSATLQSGTYNLTLSASSWSTTADSDGYYTYIVNVPNIGSSKNYLLLNKTSISSDDLSDYQSEFNEIVGGETSSNVVTLKITTVPTLNLPIILSGTYESEE